MKRLLLLLALLAAPTVQAQEQVLEVIPLKHRTVEEMVPVLRPLLSPGGTLTGMNDQLVIRTDPANLEQIRQVLSRLDRPLRRLRITVSQSAVGTVERDSSGLSGHYEGGDLRARVPGTGRGGASVGISGDQGEIRYRSLSTRREEDRRHLSFVVTTEGRPAWIQAGEDIPLPHTSAVIRPDGVVVHQGIEYRNVSSGFYVIPRLSGDRVTLAIAPRLERSTERGGRIDLQQVTTTVSGRLGEWIELGGIDELTTGGGRRNLSLSTRRGTGSRRIRVKVELLP